MPSSSIRPIVLAACLTASLPWLASSTHAADLGLKPGLWEVRIIKQVVDGRDHSAQITASLAQAQQALANLPPAERQRVQALMNQAGVSTSGNGNFRICVTAAMAQRNLPILDKDGRCRPVLVSQSGNQTRFRFDCNTNGTSMDGTGEATVSGDLISTHTHVTERGADGATHVIDNDTQMQYVSADCGELSTPHG